MYKHISSDVISNLESVDPGLCTQLMELFLSDLPQQKIKIDQLKTPQTSFEFGKAIHALKGSIAVFGCPEICKTLKDAELLAKENQFDQAVSLYERSQPLITELTQEIQGYVKSKAS